MIEVLLPLCPPTCVALPAPISSPESADGITPSSLPAGPPSDLFGRPLSPASRSAAPGGSKGSGTTVTFGRSFSGSSASAALQRSLENRLKQVFDTDGSIEFSLTWRRTVTPAGRLLCRLAASERRISASGSSGWRSPDSNRRGGSYQDPGKVVARIEAGHQVNLEDQAVLAGWPTPVANDDNKSPEAHLAMKRRMGERDGSGANRTAITSLQVMAQLAGWGTPNTMDYLSSRNLAKRKLKGGCSNLKDQVAGLELASGPPSTSPPAPTAKRGALNPEHSRWLMGYPPAWGSCAPTAMPSSRKPRPHS